MANYKVAGTDLTSVADAIRTKGGTSASLSFPDGFVTAIGNIETQQMTTIVPEQTVTVSGSYTQITFDAAIEAGEEYVVTINGTTKTLTAAGQYGSVYLAFTTNTVMIDYSSPKMYLDVFDSSLYGSYTVKVEQARGATLITKSISANGTYNASDDNADGYSSVTVATPFVSGTFTASDAEKGTAKSITIPYTGSGYPIAGIIYPTAGAYKSGEDIYDEIHQNLIPVFSFAKCVADTTPTYAGTGVDNQAMVAVSYKRNATEAANYTGNAYANASFYNSSAAQASLSYSVHMSSATAMTVFIADTGVGFRAGTEYTYRFIYSS